jgi:phenylacetate-CoA ligase
VSIYNFNDLVNFVRKESPYYKELYSDLKDEFSIEDLPILCQDDFWSKNTFSNNKVLTSDLNDGVVFKSGGTTGNPKFSAFTKDEWNQFTKDFGQGMDQLKMQEGDLCANLFYSGDLYASFLFINKSVEQMKTPVAQFPITGQTDVEEALSIISTYKVNVLFGVPTSLLSMAAHSHEVYENVNQIYYGGEPLFEDQKEQLLKTFPNAYISSIGYASVDGGQLGYVDESCSKGEHKVFKSTIVEIVNPDTGEVIKNCDEVGKLVFTNLTRKLMPIIKYPVGDMGRWIEYPKKFQLLGRSDEGARIGPITINRDDITDIFKSYNLLEKVKNFQLIIKRKDSKDYLELIIASENNKSLENELENLRFSEKFYFQRKMYQQELNKGQIEEFSYKVVNIDNLVKNPRTGKLRLVIDQRF